MGILACEQPGLQVLSVPIICVLKITGICWHVPVFIRVSVYFLKEFISTLRPCPAAMR